MIYLVLLIYGIIFLMNLPLILDTVLVVVAVVLGIFFIYVLINLARTLSTFNSILKEVGSSLPSLLKKLETTLNDIDNELKRADEIMKSAEDITRKVNATAEVVKEVISSPLIKLASLSSGARKALNFLLKRD